MLVPSPFGSFNSRQVSSPEDGPVTRPPCLCAPQRSYVHVLHAPTTATHGAGARAMARAPVLQPPAVEPRTLTRVVSTSCALEAVRLKRKAHARRARASCCRHNAKHVVNGHGLVRRHGSTSFQVPSRKPRVSLVGRGRKDVPLRAGNTVGTGVKAEVSRPEEEQGDGRGEQRGRETRSSAVDGTKGGRGSAPDRSRVSTCIAEDRSTPETRRDVRCASFANRSFVRPDVEGSIHPEGSTTRRPGVERGAYVDPVADVDDPLRDPSLPPTPTIRPSPVRPRVPGKGGIGVRSPLFLPSRSSPRLAEARTRVTARTRHT